MKDLSLEDIRALDRYVYKQQQYANHALPVLNVNILQTCTLELAFVSAKLKFRHFENTR